MPTITYTGASISPDTGEPQDFTNPVSYTVTAANNSTQGYLVTVSVGANPAKAITAFSFNGLSPVVTGSIDEELKTIALTVPPGTSVAALVPSITHTGAGVVPASEEPQDFSNPVSYTVTAADGSTQDYTVTTSVTPGITANFVNVLTTDTTATFTWTAATGASEVKIKISPKGQNDWTDATTEETLNDASTSGSVYGLTESTSYDFKLLVTGGSLAGDSDVVNITTLTAQQAAIDYVNAAAGQLCWDFPPDIDTLNTATGQSNAINDNYDAYQTAIEAANANSLNTAAKIQMFVNTVNVTAAKAAASITCADPAASPVTLERPADLTEAGVTFTFDDPRDVGVSTDINGGNAVISRDPDYDGGTVLTLSITCVTGGQTATDTIDYVVKVPSSESHEDISWGAPPPEPIGYIVAPGTAHPGTPGGTSSITYTSGYSLFYTLKPGFILPPIADEDSSSYIEWLTPYSSGEDITGAVYGNHLGLYEINTGNNHVVTFVDIILGANDIEAGAGGLAAPGITGFSLEDNPPSSFIVITYTPAAGNTLRYVKQTSAFETPAVNAAAPAIGANPGEATEYASGDTITIDRSTDYIGLYEVNASSQVVRFVDVIFARPL